jgi:hypothetical protein
MENVLLGLVAGGALACPALTLWRRRRGAGERCCAPSSALSAHDAPGRDLERLRTRVDALAGGGVPERPEEDRWRR